MRKVITAFQYVSSDLAHARAWYEFCPGSFEIHAPPYTPAKVKKKKKKKYLYELLQISVEMNIRGSKTQTTCIPFCKKYELELESFNTIL